MLVKTRKERYNVKRKRRIQMIEKEVVVKARKKNMKLYPIYRMLSYDIIFIYAIKFIFQVQVKNITPGNVLLATSIFALFMVFMQVPATILIDKLGYKKSALISNLSNIIYVALIMISNDLPMLLLAEFISAITFSIKNVADPCLLDMSIPQATKKRQIFSKLEGKGSSNYYYLNAITAIASGFMYAVNPYLPFACSMIVTGFACLLNLQFEEVEKDAVLEEIRLTGKDRVNQYIQELKEAFHFIFQSKRLRGLMIFGGVLWGFHCVISDYKTNLLQVIGANSQVIGIITAILYISSGIASRKQLTFHNRFKNKSLSVIAFSTGISAIVMGIVVVLGLPFYVALLIIIMVCIINYAGNGIFQVLNKRYLGNFTNENILPKIYSTDSFLTNILRAAIGIPCSLLLDTTSAASATIIVGVIFTILMIGILKYMKTRVGLQPEQYDKQETKYAFVQGETNDRKNEENER